MAKYKALKIFTGNAHRKLAEEIAEYLGVKVSQAEVNTFSDGEICVGINESVRGTDAFVIQPTCAPVNNNLMELLIMIDALRRASARRITAVIPYYGYARQDRKAKARDPITAKLIANLLTAAGARRILSIDFHAGQIQGFFDIPVDHLLVQPLIAEYFLNKGIDDFVVVSPDLGGVTRARGLAERLQASLAIIDKRRPCPNEAEVMNIIGSVQGKNVVMIDDIIDTAGTITLGAEALKKSGARDVYACCTHPVLSGPAIQRLENSIIKEVVVTDTLPLNTEKEFLKLKFYPPLLC